MKTLFASLRIYVVLTVLCGLAYPALVTVIARGTAPRTAGGSLVTREGRTVGSTLLAQKFVLPKYVHARPSAVDYNPLASGASNLGPTSADLATQVAERRTQLKGEATDAMIYASASGLDPELDLASAYRQIPRVARERGMDESRVRSIIDELTITRRFGLFGEPRVNVLELNLALDERE